jgi:hypothetical protein
LLKNFVFQDSLLLYKYIFCFRLPKAPWSLQGTILPPSPNETSKDGSAQQSHTHKKSTSKAQRKLNATTCPSLILSNFTPMFAV